MDPEATAEALAADTAVPEPVAPSEDEQLSAIFDKADIQPDETPTEQPEVAEVVEPVVQPEPVDAPSIVPGAVKAVWKDIPEHARDPVQKAYQTLTSRLGEQGRMVQGIAPIRDTLVEAVNQLPALKDMKPEDVAKDVFALAKLSADFQTKPVETLLGYIKRHGLQSEMAQALSGQPVQDQTGQTVRALQNEVQSLRGQLAKMGDPQYLNQQFSQFSRESAVQAEVTAFADTAEHWDSVAEHIPTFLPVANTVLGETASSQDVLTKAYELAVSQLVPNAKAPEPVADEAASPDPERSKAAVKAKSVNVTSRGQGKPRPRTEDEILSATFDRAHAS